MERLTRDSASMVVVVVVVVVVVEGKPRIA